MQPKSFNITSIIEIIKFNITLIALDAPLCPGCLIAFANVPWLFTTAIHRLCVFVILFLSISFVCRITRHFGQFGQHFQCFPIHSRPIECFAMASTNEHEMQVNGSYAIKSIALSITCEAILWIENINVINTHKRTRFHRKHNQTQAQSNNVVLSTEQEFMCMWQIFKPNFTVQKKSPTTHSQMKTMCRIILWWDDCGHN